jgi:hypothetical protein
MDGEARSDRSIVIGRNVASYPDHSQDPIAELFGSRVKCDTISTGLFGIRAKVRVYVVFYAGPFGSPTALAFACQTPGTLDVEQSGHWVWAYITSFDPANWRAANGSVNAGDSNLIPDREPGPGPSEVRAGPKPW